MLLWIGGISATETSIKMLYETVSSVLAWFCFIAFGSGARFTNDFLPAIQIRWN